MKIKELIDVVLPTAGWKRFAVVIAGVIGGLGAYGVYASRTWSYLSDSPSACVNCHIMAPYYATWSHSAHSRNTTCNDCHVPHENAARKWFFKGTDGLRHAAIFTMRGEPEVIRARDESSEVIMNNCIRCHTQLNTEFVAAGRIDHAAVAEGGGKACWDCHREVPHGRSNSLSATPHALVPYPKSDTPGWLKKMLND